MANKLNVGEEAESLNDTKGLQDHTSEPYDAGRKRKLEVSCSNSLESVETYCGNMNNCNYQSQQNSAENENEKEIDEMDLKSDELTVKKKTHHKC